MKSGRSSVVGQFLGRDSCRGSNPLNSSIPLPLGRSRNLLWLNRAVSSLCPSVQRLAEVGYERAKYGSSHHAFIHASKLH